MKKLLSFIAILGFLSTASFAEDFLAKVTKGAVSDYDEGVRRLSAEEERQVVGGIAISRDSVIHYSSSSCCSGRTSYTAFYLIGLENIEKQQGVIYWNSNYSSATDYQYFRLFTTNPNESVMLQTTYNFARNSVSLSLVARNNANSSIRYIPNSHPVAQKIFQVFGGYAANKTYENRYR